MHCDIDFISIDVFLLFQTNAMVILNVPIHLMNSAAPYVIKMNSLAIALNRDLALL